MSCVARMSVIVGTFIFLPASVVKARFARAARWSNWRAHSALR